MKYKVMFCLKGLPLRHRNIIIKLAFFLAELKMIDQ